MGIQNSNNSNNYFNLLVIIVFFQSTSDFFNYARRPSAYSLAADCKGGWGCNKQGSWKKFLKKANSRGINGCKMNAWSKLVKLFHPNSLRSWKNQLFRSKFRQFRAKLSKNCKRGPPTISCQRECYSTLILIHWKES